MAVVGQAFVAPDGWSATLGQTKHEFVVKYLVQTDNHADGPLIVALADGLPLIGEYYNIGNDFHEFALCRALGNATRLEPNSLWWNVEVHFTTPEPREGSLGGSSKEAPGEQNDPTLKIPTIEMHSTEYDDVVFGVYDVTTNLFKPCASTAGEVFDPPPTKKSCTIDFVITKNQHITYAVQNAIILFVDNVNLDVFFGFPIGAVRCTGITASKETKQLATGGVIQYLKVQYAFSAKNTWDTFLLNQGSYWITKTMLDDKIIKHKFLSEEGHPIAGELKANGDKLGKDDPPVFLQYRFYQRIQFALLGLPQNFFSQ